MGVTIHYDGRLILEKCALFQEWLAAQCDALHWDLVASTQRRQPSGFFRRLSKSATDRPVFTVSTHPDCEPLVFDFDYDWKVANWVKTSFAPTHIHVAIIELLRGLSDCFVGFEIFDEGEYAETNDLELLEKNRAAFFKMLEAMIAKGAEGSIKLDDGRIIDCTYPNK
jgi:hypothetical protein